MYNAPNHRTGKPPQRFHLDLGVLMPVPSGLPQCADTVRHGMLVTLVAASLINQWTKIMSCVCSLLQTLRDCLLKAYPHYIAQGVHWWARVYRFKFWSTVHVHQAHITYVQ